MHSNSYQVSIFFAFFMYIFKRYVAIPINTAKRTCQYQYQYLSMHTYTAYIHIYSSVDYPITQLTAQHFDTWSTGSGNVIHS